MDRDDVLYIIVSEKNFTTCLKFFHIFGLSQKLYIRYKVFYLLLGDANSMMSSFIHQFKYYLLCCFICSRQLGPSYSTDWESASWLWPNIQIARLLLKNMLNWKKCYFLLNYLFLYKIIWHLKNGRASPKE